MSWDEVAAAGAVLIALVGVAQFLASHRPKLTRRAEIKASLELHELLPAESEARAALLAHVERQVHEMIRVEVDEVRNWSHVASGGYLIVAGSLLPSLFNSWWVALVAVPFIGMGFGMVDDGIKRSRRNDQGLRIRSKPAIPATAATDRDG